MSRVGDLIDGGDEVAAAAAMDRLAEQVPPTSGLAMHAWFMGAAAWYVLRPDDRAMLDAFMVDDLFAEANALFRSFVIARESGSVPAELIEEFPPPATIGTVLPARWAAEFALRLPATHRSLRDQILEGLFEQGRPMINALAESPNDNARLTKAASDLRAHSPQPPPAPVTATLCGPTHLDTGAADPPAEWRRGRVRALLGLLALRGPITREGAIDVLWPELDLAAGRRNLRVTLSYLGRALEPSRLPHTPSWFVRTEQELITLHHDDLTLDVTTIAAALHRAARFEQQGLASQTISALEAACSAYGGPLLAGLDDVWIEEERAAMARRVHTAALRLSALQLAGGLDDAARWADLALEIDPWSVDAHEAKIDALERQGSPELETARTRLAIVLGELGVG